MSNATTALQHNACLTSGQCLNGGTCAVADNDTSGFRQCLCPEGFGGFRCENYCPLDCQNAGVCQQVGSSNRIENYMHDAKINKNNYVCKCKGYFTGNLCQTRYVNCGGHQCLNGATCAAPPENATVGPWCHCAKGFLGDHCQYSVAQDSAKQKAATGSVLGVLFCAIMIAFIVVYRKRKRTRTDMERQLGIEERQNLHTAIPREEREDWECRNII